MGSPLFPSTRSRTPLRAGFTLIEILVVIAIIAILAALIFPAIGGALRSGKQATSVSNLRQWGSAFHASWTEYDGEMPSDGSSVDTGAAEQAWFNRMPPKLNLPALKNMPAGEAPKLGMKSLWINPGAPIIPVTGIPFTYGYNDYLSSSAEPTMKVTRVEHPEKTALMVEKRPDSSPAGNPANITAYYGAKDPADPAAVCNVLFVDGHVAPVAHKVFSDPNSLADSDTAIREAQFLWSPFPGASQ
jgi:prepilin-type N-terminal cleavage/methylation domain-containing protein/prepilin-type processing-associated H-X9-DG protein